MTSHSLIPEIQNKTIFREYNLTTMTSQVVFFDGFCNLCNASVRFIIRNDPEGVFAFSSLTSDYSLKILKNADRFNYPANSILLFDEDRVFDKSTAVLRISRKLKGIWPLFYVLIVVPKPIRDYFYDLLAKHRYKIFGRTDSCSLPETVDKWRFLE